MGAKNKRYFWLKIGNDFFKEKAIKRQIKFEKKEKKKKKKKENEFPLVKNTTFFIQ